MIYEIMMLHVDYYVYEVFISVFKTSLSCIVIEIPGDRYTPPAVLIMKISIIHEFLPIFVLNGGESPARGDHSPMCGRY